MANASAEVRREQWLKRVIANDELPSGTKVTAAFIALNASEASRHPHEHAPLSFPAAALVTTSTQEEISLAIGGKGIRAIHRDLSLLVKCGALRLHHRNQVGGGTAHELVEVR